ncbi:MAG: STAS domain-containing protein [Acidimicrobiia bacterium]|nr:STAS domain-containing protein [Acidimicrobiia bacterium]
MAGDLDLATVPRVRSELVRVLATLEDPPRVVLDLYGVDLVDSLGLALVLEVVRRCAQRGGSVAIARVEPAVRREFDLTGLSTILPLHVDVDSAARSLATGQP